MSIIRHKNQVVFRNTTDSVNYTTAGLQIRGNLLISAGNTSINNLHVSNSITSGRLFVTGTANLNTISTGSIRGVFSTIGNISSSSLSITVSAKVLNSFTIGTGVYTRSTFANVNYFGVVTVGNMRVLNNFSSDVGYIESGTNVTRVSRGNVFVGTTFTSENVGGMFLTTYPGDNGYTKGPYLQFGGRVSLTTNPYTFSMINVSRGNQALLFDCQITGGSPGVYTSITAGSRYQYTINKSGGSLLHQRSSTTSIGVITLTPSMGFFTNGSVVIGTSIPSDSVVSINPNISGTRPSLLLHDNFLVNNYVRFGDEYSMAVDGRGNFAIGHNFAVIPTAGNEFYPITTGNVHNYSLGYHTGITHYSLHSFFSYGTHGTGITFNSLGLASVKSSVIFTTYGSIGATSNDITGTKGNVNINGDLVLSDTQSNTIFFRQTTSAPPTLTNRSDGMRIVLSANISGTATDYGYGTDNVGIYQVIDGSGSTVRNFDYFHGNSSTGSMSLMSGGGNTTRLQVGTTAAGGSITFGKNANVSWTMAGERYAGEEMLSFSKGLPTTPTYTRHVQLVATGGSLGFTKLSLYHTGNTSHGFVINVNSTGASLGEGGPTMATLRNNAGNLEFRSSQNRSVLSLSLGTIRVYDSSNTSSGALFDMGIAVGATNRPTGSSAGSIGYKVLGTAGLEIFGAGPNRVIFIQDVLCIGTSSTRANLYVDTVRSSDTVARNYQERPTTGSPVYYWDSQTATVIQNISIVCSKGFAATGQISIASDKRIKKEVQTITSKECLEKIMALRPVTFRYKVSVSDIQKALGVLDSAHPVPLGVRHIGFIAQDIERVIPEAVTTLTDFIPCDGDVYTSEELKVFITSNPGVYSIMFHNGKELKSLVINSINEIPKNTRVYLYGKKETDVKTIKYDFITSLLLGAMKEVYHNL